MIRENLNLRMEKSIGSAKIEAAYLFKKNFPQVTIIILTKTIILEFLRMYFFKLGFLKGTRGLINAQYQALDKAIELTYLWEMQNTDGKKIN